MAAYYGFFSWQGFGPPTDFVGLRNYVTILTDPTFHDALRHNAFIMVMSLVMQGPIAIALALLLNRKMRGQSVIRVLIFVPYVISEVVVGTGWSLMLQTSGAVNDLLGKLGLEGLQRDWLSDPKIAIWTLMIIITWKYVGFAVILFLAGLQGIPPEELSEAAAIDGASYWQVQRRITLPLLGPPTLRIWRSCRSSARCSCSTSSTSSGGASTWPRPRAPRPWRPTWSSTGGTPAASATATPSPSSSSSSR